MCFTRLSTFLVLPSSFYSSLLSSSFITPSFFLPLFPIASLSYSVDSIFRIYCLNLASFFVSSSFSFLSCLVFNSFIIYFLFLSFLSSFKYFLLFSDSLFFHPSLCHPSFPNHRILFIYVYSFVCLFHLLLTFIPLLLFPIFYRIIYIRCFSVFFFLFLSLYAPVQTYVLAPEIQRVIAEYEYVTDTRSFLSIKGLHVPLTEWPNAVAATASFHETNHESIINL